MKNTNTNIAHNTENVNNNSPFELAKRAFEKAYASGVDYSAELEALATAIAKSVLNKVIDPQRKSAGEKNAVSNSGINKALDELKRGIYFDGKNLANIRHWTNTDYEMAYTKDGDIKLEEGKDANDGLAALIDYAITDGYDFVQTAALALLEQAAEHAASGENWLDCPFTVRRLSKRVYIRETDSRAYKDVETTAIQECYRAVRRHVAASRAVSTDPRSPYTYISIDAYEPEALEQIFIRAGKYADVGGVDCNGLYTGDMKSFRAYNDVDKLLEKLNFTARELQIIKLRMRGYGAKAIGTYLGISDASIRRTVHRMRDKVRKEMEK